MKVCPICYNVYFDKEYCPSLICGHSKNFNVDDGLAFIIAEFNKVLRNSKDFSGIKTKFSCEGHIYNHNEDFIIKNFPQCYVLFEYTDKDNITKFDYIFKFYLNLLNLKNKNYLNHLLFYDSQIIEDGYLVSYNFFAGDYSLTEMSIFIKFKADFQIMLLEVINHIKEEKIC